MLDSVRQFLIEIITQLLAVSSETVALVVLLIAGIIVVDNFDLISRRKRKHSGLAPESIAVSIDGSKALPVKDYISEIQGISGRPDAVVLENGYLIPIERKPLAKKLRDRYIAQLLVYMRLVEEFEGKKPPYGYLILGPNCRRFKIYNTKKRQEWLQGMLEQMRAMLDGAAPDPKPHPRKCGRCSVRQHCKYKLSPRSQDSSSKSPAKVEVVPSQ